MSIAGQNEVSLSVIEEDVALWPVERLSELVNKVDDSYFLAALTRLTLGGISNIKLF